MKATFALLANTEVHNLARKLAWRLHSQYHTGLSITRLPPHVSLKQPFAVSDLGLLEQYMTQLAASVAPLDVRLKELQLIPVFHEGMEYGLLWIEVEESAELRGLHERVHRELAQAFANTEADFDGAPYHFHMTVTMGGQPIEAYRQFLKGIADLGVNLQFRAGELAMFVYDEPIGPNGEYMTYKILPLKG